MLLLPLYFGLILIWPITFTVRQNPVLQIPAFEVFWSFKFQVLQIQSPFISSYFVAFHS